MNRIQEIQIVDVAYRSPYVAFLDEVDIEHNLSGKTYRPSYPALEILRRLARGMVVDIRFGEGVITLRRPQISEHLAQHEASQQSAQTGSVDCGAQVCPHCGFITTVSSRGRFHNHGPRSSPCPGSGEAYVPATNTSP